MKSLHTFQIWCQMIRNVKLVNRICWGKHKFIFGMLMNKITSICNSPENRTDIKQNTKLKYL